METPSSARRVTRSQTIATQNGNNIPILNFEKGLSNSRQRKGKQQDRSVLVDITNDSPIVGVAVGKLETPLSSMAKQAKNTPGSGEALLRGQVKTLLQKVEEEAELSKLTLESRPFVHLKGLVYSPAGLLAPTPANTPQISNFSGEEVSMNNNNGLSSEAPSPIVEEQLAFQVGDDKPEESLEMQKSIITRSLLLDFSEKSDSCDSVVTYQGDETESKEKSTPDDDSSSIWSTQVNASTLGEDDDEEEEEDFEEDEEEDYDFEEGYEYGEEEQNELVDELCDCISKISMNEKKTLPKFAGKHTKFVYDSDDDNCIVKVEETCVDLADGASSSPSIVKLNGLPTPKGKHLRFLEVEKEMTEK
ncbi:uncharacterized protein LOC133812765 [Humulus lupulus]|uniref:uncharacterized protein LOC133812765 n=1 Tax=Humulus lupulus TaxID=3486 RepID=UPI002B402D48|nr:uncharacterized protein LOC133812765 [Humulus lupulus]